MRWFVVYCCAPGLISCPFQFTWPFTSNDLHGLFLFFVCQLSLMSCLVFFFFCQSLKSVRYQKNDQFSLSMSCLSNLVEASEDSFYFCLCRFSHHLVCHLSWLRLSRARRRGPLWRRGRPLKDVRRWGARKAQTPLPPLLQLRRRSRGKRPAGVCWPQRRPPLSARTLPQRAQTALKSTFQKHRRAFEGDSEREECKVRS